MNIEHLPVDQKSIGLPGPPDCTDRKLLSTKKGSNKRTHHVHTYRSYIAIVTSLSLFLRSHPIGRAIALTTGALLICVGLAGGWAMGLQMVGNVHVVEDGALYRSAQLNEAKLADVIAAYGIKSVINLRGENHGSWWYDDEVKVTTAHGASHFDVRMTALRDTDDATVTQLMETLRAAPRPMLIHCESGSDRTGLAAALYERFLKQQPAEVAAGQISFRYGHFPWLGNRTVAMDQTYWRLSADGLPKSK